ncbi:YciI family protein [Streptomyces sp. NPDC006879]|uniref:YciI family protein n=1 Tax=Streptomyces sp. NPDC006879 TaxID=3364767 RepID=UPI0036C6AB66
MFVMELTYTGSIEAAEALMEPHIAWLDAQYEAGIFLASGRKVPRDGGVVLAAGVPREEIERLAAQDPFTQAGVCTYRITEFVATKTSADLTTIRE